MNNICAACPEYLEKRDMKPGDWCTVHWSTVEAEVKSVGFVCEHHTH
jgi:hypothetical protein